MNKEEIVNEFLKKGLQYLESAEAFAVKQIPDYLQQVLAYKAIEHTALVILGILGIVLSLYTFWNILIKKDEDNKRKIDKNDLYGIYAFISVPSLIGSTVMICNNFTNTIMIYTAPKVYLLEYLKGLI